MAATMTAPLSAAAPALSAPLPGDLMLSPFQARFYIGSTPEDPPKVNAKAKRSFGAAFEHEYVFEDATKSASMSLPAMLDLGSDAYCRSNEVIDRIYRELRKDSNSLKFGSDTLLENLPAKRARKAKDMDAPVEPGSSALARPPREHTTVSHGYGEFTRGAIETYLDYLHPHVEKGDSFCDIGSGHGRVVLHAAAREKRFFKVTGIEAMRARHDVAAKTLAKVQTDLCDDGAEDKRNRVELVCADAAEVHFWRYQHLFMYDYVFSERTHKAVLPNITYFKTLTTSLTPKKMRKRGLGHMVKLLFKNAYSTTGGTRHTLYTYERDVGTEVVADIKDDTAALDGFMRGWQSEPEAF